MNLAPQTDEQKIPLNSNKGWPEWREIFAANYGFWRAEMSVALALHRLVLHQATLRAPTMASPGNPFGEQQQQQQLSWVPFLPVVRPNKSRPIIILDDQTTAINCIVHFTSGRSHFFYNRSFHWLDVCWTFAGHSKIDVRRPK